MSFSFSQGENRVTLVSLVSARIELVTMQWPEKRQDNEKTFCPRSENSTKIYSGTISFPLRSLLLGKYIFFRILRNIIFQAGAGRSEDFARVCCLKG